MDAILDSNVFLSDVKFQGTQFPELFAYLRRTGDTLVLPNLVMEETLERYGEQLKNTLNQAKGAWELFRKTRMSSHPKFPYVDFDKEVQEYKQRLLAPAPSVNVLQYVDVSGVHVNEIARRGIKRIKPASKAGEELRDVLIWLLVFQYAKQTHKEVAFISGDKAFRISEDEDGLHPDLASEIAGSKLPIHFYRKIAMFVTSQSLSDESVGTEWFDRFVASEDVHARISEAILATETKYGWPHDISLEFVEFSEGKAYKVSQRSVYAELKYTGRAKLTFETIPLTVRNNVFISGSMGNLSQMADVDKIVHTLSPPPKYVANLQDLYTTSIDALGPVREGVLMATPFVKNDRLFDFGAWVSARIDDEQLVSWQIDRLQLSDA
jgi:hypothetical protein